MSALEIHLFGFQEDDWWYKHVHLDPSMTGFYEDDEIEIDDASLLAAMTTNGNVIPKSEENGTMKVNESSDLECNDSGASGSTEEEFLRSFRTEVAEIYQQLRQMCVEVSAQSFSNASSIAGHRPGDWTPDQLSRIEWDCRLASLRNVLTDLRGLLQDLVAIPIKA